MLAGGVGRRFGRAKGNVELDGTTLAARAASVLWPLCGSVLVSMRSGDDNPAPGFPALAVVDAAGRIDSLHLGVIDRGDLEAAVEDARRASEGP